MEPREGFVSLLTGVLLLRHSLEYGGTRVSVRAIMSLLTLNDTAVREQGSQLVGECSQSRQPLDSLPTALGSAVADSVAASVSIEEAAAYLKLTPRHVLELAKLGLLPSVKTGEAARRIRSKDLLHYARQREQLRNADRECPLSGVWDEPRFEHLYATALNVSQ